MANYLALEFGKIERPSLHPSPNRGWRILWVEDSGGLQHIGSEHKGSDTTEAIKHAYTQSVELVIIELRFKARYQ